jgi:hypothetical protein
MNVNKSMAKLLVNRTDTGREASFDYCYNYFQSFRRAETTAKLADPANLEMSCLHLGFYLASWGMFRGSTALIGTSLPVFVPVIQAIAAEPAGTWTLDLKDYQENGDPIVKVYERLRKTLPKTRSGYNATETLVTKIMLGVFGSVPAFDQYVVAGFRSYQKSVKSRAAPFGTEALSKLWDLYTDPKLQAHIDTHAMTTKTLAFGAAPGKRNYPRAKILDMLLYVEGGGPT